jgi:2-keto-3-deoxy-L-rhamnonate aldolase RhmA
MQTAARDSSLRRAFAILAGLTETMQMRRRSMLPLLVTAALALGSQPLAHAREAGRFNPVIGLIEKQQAVIGLYAPTHREPGAAASRLSPRELARATVDYRLSDFVFDGSMEYDFEATFPAFADFAGALGEAGALSRTPYLHLAHPMIVKVPQIAADPAQAASRIAKQLNQGVSGIMFVGVESAEEVRQGIAAMRFAANGGKRPDAVGSAPAYWGMSEHEYRRKADLWPLNPQGELINWVVVESKEGLKHVREIAAVKGIGVLWPGAGTLRGVFSTVGPNGKRVLDEPAWEAAIQQVLAACKEFHVPCGFPAGPDTIEKRIRQGFSVFVVPWGDAGFKAVQIGRKAANRPLPQE